MNGPIKMYRTQQIVHHDFPVELPKCMYKLNNIHSTGIGMEDGAADHVSSPTRKLDIFDQVKQFLKNNYQIPGMAELEAKQEKILKQLADLKEQILSIKSDLKFTTISSIKSDTNFSTNCYIESINNEIPEIIINANVTSPPYSLLMLQKLLKDTITITFTSHLHSTVSSLPECAKLLENSLTSFTSTPESNVPRPVINIRLIWKEIGNNNTEVLVSHIPILGEVNMLRYLSRAIKSSLSYDSLSDRIEIDSLLDICYLIVRAKTKTERTSLLQSLNKSLGKSQWLLGRNEAGIVDVAAYSAIKQVSLINELSANLVKWFQRCEALC